MRMHLVHFKRTRECPEQIPKSRALNCGLQPWTINCGTHDNVDLLLQIQHTTCHCMLGISITKCKVNTIGRNKTNVKINQRSHLYYTIMLYRDDLITSNAKYFILHGPGHIILLHWDLSRNLRVWRYSYLHRATTQKTIRRVRATLSIVSKKQRYTSCDPASHYFQDIFCLSNCFKHLQLIYAW